MSDRPQPVRSFAVDRLSVHVYARREEMGRAAALDVATRMREILRAGPRIRMVFAAAASQNEFLATLAAAPDLDWGRVEAFHMDEYIGLPAGAPQGFGRFLRERLFGLVRPGRVEYVDGQATDAQAEAQRYAALLAERPIDVVCAGIGENGHMAFNDPHVANFRDRAAVKIVMLDTVCRTQQVHDGAFERLDQVPLTAVTLTMPTLMSAWGVYCVVPGPSKAAAVRRTLRGPIGEECPATIMRRHPQATLYIDADSAAEA